ncbi:DgyrCDS9049 [Dimorphilus gyrociliatus]|uniref:DgyrCDS9049 n=1 Tax=Dimorphilus gyrociliatus TaxID=2664684 RepID=A0A7I8VWA4_9ANNE|nr:DgyrCDS9049 [Dimorphilus gyrociliatus]
MVDAPPPSYEEVIRAEGAGIENSYPNQSLRSAGSDLRFTFIDFTANCLIEKNKFFKCEYEKFCILIKEANEWLAQNATFAVINCEVLCCQKDGVSLPLQTDKSYQIPQTRTEQNGEVSTEYKYLNLVKFLRVYLRSKNPGEPLEADQIGHTCIQPTNRDKSMPSSYSYYSYDDTLIKFNSTNKACPVEGRINNVERIGLNREKNPEELKQYEDSDKIFHVPLCTMVYYIRGQSADPRIPIENADFIPAVIQNSSCFYFRKHESFTSLMSRIQTWVRTNSFINILNLQTIQVSFNKAKREDVAYDPGYFRTKYTLKPYVRFIRIYFTRTFDAEPRPDFTISCRTFLPALQSRTAKGRSPTFETMSSLLRREIFPFLQYNSKAKIINAETLPYLYKAKVDDMQSYTGDSEVYAYISCIRIFFEGLVTEPPPGYIPLSNHPRIYEDAEECCLL